MSTDAAMYEARISAAPYAGRVQQHLTEYLMRLLEGVIAQHTLVRTVEHEVDSGPDHDTVTVRVRFEAASDAQASAIASEAGVRIGATDEHWQLTGVAVERVGAES